MLGDINNGNMAYYCTKKNGLILPVPLLFPVLRKFYESKEILLEF